RSSDFPGVFVYSRGGACPRPRFVQPPSDLSCHVPIYRAYTDLATCSSSVPLRIARASGKMVSSYPSTRKRNRNSLEETCPTGRSRSARSGRLILSPFFPPRTCTALRPHKLVLLVALSESRNSY